MVKSCNSLRGMSVAEKESNCTQASCPTRLPQGGRERGLPQDDASHAEQNSKGFLDARRQNSDHFRIRFGSSVDSRHHGGLVVSCCERAQSPREHQERIRIHLKASHYMGNAKSEPRALSPLYPLAVPKPAPDIAVAQWAQRAYTLSVEADVHRAAAEKAASYTTP